MILQGYYLTSSIFPNESWILFVTYCTFSLGQTIMFQRLCFSYLFWVQLKHNYESSDLVKIKLKFFQSSREKRFDFRKLSIWSKTVSLRNCQNCSSKGSVLCIFIFREVSKNLFEFVLQVNSYDFWKTLPRSDLIVSIR